MFRCRLVIFTFLTLLLTPEMSNPSQGEKELGAVSVNSQSSEAHAIDHDTAKEKRLVRKTDLLMMPGLGELYLPPLSLRPN